MKKVLFTLIALVISASAFAQLIANKTDKKVTAGVDLFSDLQLAPSDNWNPRGFNQGASWALTYNFPLGESKKHTVSIGVGMTHHNYFSYNHILNPYADTLQYAQCADLENFKRFKVNANYADVPFELRFRIKDQVKIGIGFKLGILDNLERYTYSATLRVGWRWVSAFAAYQINPVFEVGHNAPTFHPLSVGLSFAPF